jgi:hypothetical protein
VDGGCRPQNQGGAHPGQGQGQNNEQNPGTPPVFQDCQRYLKLFHQAPDTDDWMGYAARFDEYETQDKGA